MKILLVLAELSHLVLHGKVLLSVGQLYSVEDYKQKRYYFVLDALTVILAYMYTNMSSMYTTLMLGHFLLHSFYILNWNNVNSFFVNSIVEWSAEKNHKERMYKHGSPMYLYNTFGTMFDMYVHGMMLYGMLNK